MADDRVKVEDGIQHGIDDDPNNDAAKGAALGGIGGAAVGAAAGAMTGPVGAVIGAVVGGALGAAGSAAGVAAVDRVDNDNNVTGVGDDIARDDDEFDDTNANATYTTAAAPGTMAGSYGTGTGAYDTGVRPGVRDMGVGNGIPGVQTGGRDIDGTPDTRGISEKAADAVTGNRIDDKTGKPVV